MIIVFIKYTEKNKYLLLNQLRNFVETNAMQTLGYL